MKVQLKQILQKILSDMGIAGVEPVVEIPTDPAHGDYTTNVAMVVAKRLKRNPLEIAQEIKTKLTSYSLQKISGKLDQITYQSGLNRARGKYAETLLQDIEKIDVVPPGFINFYLSESKLITDLHSVLIDKERFGSGRKKSGQKIMVEFAHPNTHKAFHIGHLRNITTGESIVRLLESQGQKVIRANYQGDVGMHIAKAMYGLISIEEYKKQYAEYSSNEVRRLKQSFRPSASNIKLVSERVNLLGKAYAAGSKVYEEDEKAKQKIHDYNFLIYAAAQRFWQEKGLPKSSTDYLTFVKGRKEEVEEVYELWKETRQWSLDYFESIYKRVGSHFDRYYFESECLAGVDEAKEAVKRGVLAESEGAIVFKGKPYGLDTRVFVNSLGLPTYEGKELALATTQFKEHGHIDQLIHVLGPEQWSFTQVTFKVEVLLGIQKDQQLHLVYGWVRLKQGKMSSRSGNVVLGEWLIDQAKKGIYNIIQSSASNYKKEEQEVIAEKAAIAAVKYSFLKVSTKQEIAFDLAESVSFEGDSGPYLQYTYARARSVLRKAGNVVIPGLTGDPKIDSRFRGNDKVGGKDSQWNNEELLVLRQLYKFPEIVAEAAQNYSPNLLCKYLYDLSSSYNTFYNKHSILDAGNKSSINFRLALTQATAQTIKNGLYLLGIETMEKM